MGALEPVTTTVTPTGGVTLPQAVLEQRRWPAGTKLIIEETPGGVRLKSLPVFPLIPAHSKRPLERRHSLSVSQLSVGQIVLIIW